jgi:ribosomal protein S18 acetylase RimI-like enzyme
MKPEGSLPWHERRVHLPVKFLFLKGGFPMPNREFSIRPAQEKDLDALTGLLGELFTIEKDFTSDVLRQRSGLKLMLGEPKAIVFAAESRGEVVGMCTVQTVISTAEGGPAGIVEDMVVSQSNRAKGIGRALLKAAEAWAKENSMTRLQLLSESYNEPAQIFYLKSGWEKTALACLRKMLPK